MNIEKVKEVAEQAGLDEGYLNLPVVYDALRDVGYVYEDENDIKNAIEVKGDRAFRIGSATFKIRNDGKIEISRSGFSGYYVANEYGFEFEHIHEVTGKSERKSVRGDGTIKEIEVTDQGETVVDKSVTLDNGHPVFHKARGRYVEFLGSPMYFNPDEVLRDFDEHTGRFHYSTASQKRYCRELRKKVEERMQDAKIARLPLKEQVAALNDLKDDLEREYRNLCDFIELDLEAQRANLDFIERAFKLKSVKKDFAEELHAYRIRVKAQRIDPYGDGEIYPRILPYTNPYVEDRGQPEDIRLLTERNALEEKIYEYRKRNAELRARKDRTTEMISAMVPLYNAIASEQYPKGFILRYILKRYEKISGRIQAKKEEKAEDVRVRELNIIKRREDKKEKARFVERRKARDEAIKTNLSTTGKAVTPKKEERNLNDGEEQK